MRSVVAPMIDPNALLNRLDGVRQLRPDRWQAKCPAHDDRTPSLSITLVEDRILLHCHTGTCEVSAILAAMGLTWADICPPREVPYRQALDHLHHRQRRAQEEREARPEYRRLHASWVVAIAAEDKRRGIQHDLWDRATLALAVDILKGGQAHG